MCGGWLSCSNVWWRDCCNPCCNPSPYGKFFRRLIHAIYSLIVTSKKHMVYIPFVVGIVMVLVGTWIITEARRQEAESQSGRCLFFVVFPSSFCLHIIPLLRSVLGLVWVFSDWFSAQLWNR
jgi:hypothetical protein